MKRYLLFSGQNFYPSGGMGDYSGSYETLEAAINGTVDSGDEWYEVVYIENDGTLRLVGRGKVTSYYDFDNGRYKVEFTPFLD